MRGYAFVRVSKAQANYNKRSLAGIPASFPFREELGWGRELGT
jgi:hypothetical protein